MILEYFIYGILGLFIFYLVVKIGAWAVFQAYFQVRQLYTYNKGSPTHDSGFDKLNTKKEQPNNKEESKK